MLATAKIENQPFDLINDFELGFARGSLWNNLYVPFKYENTNMNSSLTLNDNYHYLLMVYTFASIELSLYLATHKNDQNCIDTLQRVNAELEKVKVLYEANYKSLSSFCETNVASFISDPWPWEGM